MSAASRRFAADVLKGTGRIGLDLLKGLGVAILGAFGFRFTKRRQATQKVVVHHVYHHRDNTPRPILVRKVR
jgi:hypothetical protein